MTSEHFAASPKLSTREPFTPEPSATVMRMAALSSSDVGTPESLWLDWLSARAPWPTVDFGVDRLIVIAAHPDDEVLGCGGIMTAAAGSGVEVVTVCISDGSGSHPGSRTVSPERLATLRHHELDTAATILGLQAPRWLNLPDGALALHAERIDTLIAAVIAEQPAVSTGVLSVWSHDGHPDHEVAGMCAQAVGARLGVPVWMYPIWMWHWASPNDAEVPWQSMHVHQLDDRALKSKRAAVRAFATQIYPLSPAPEDRAVLGPHMLSHLLRAQEFVII